MLSVGGMHRDVRLSKLMIRFLVLSFCQGWTLGLERLGLETSRDVARSRLGLGTQYLDLGHLLTYLHLAFYRAGFVNIFQGVTLFNFEIFPLTYIFCSLRSHWATFFRPPAHILYFPALAFYRLKTSPHNLQMLMTKEKHPDVRLWRAVRSTSCVRLLIS